ncbi:extracellular solute-binding protein [Natronohydrobacter thiooxidans]|uniref:extracellular solute-binding protein n=1 Tax=Natronohydrobacter thiooxidans TaxID=87172 RepID=UPI0008FF05F5|nr:extracellular solute-binding protein [Natronohydrobacter thiooxidans]
MSFLRNSVFALAAFAATPTLADLTLYSGRGEPLVAPIIEAFTAQTGITVNVRYAGTAELAVLLQEEGDASPADLYWAQDATALGAVAELMQSLPEAVVGSVPAAYRDAENRWVATSGRGRIMARATDRVSDDELPGSIFDLTAPEWKGRVVWAPTNGALHGHLTAMRAVIGEEETRAFLEALIANEPIAVRNNTAIVQSILDGEGDIGITNNYYVSRALSRDAEAPVDQALFDDGDIGNLLLVAAVGVLNSSGHSDEAVQFVEFLLSPKAQQFFVSDVQEFEVVPGATIPTGRMLNMEQVLTAAPQVDLNTLTDLEGTLQMLRDLGVL